MTNQIDKLMKLADNYAHVYAFVGDDSMPIARKALEDAILAHMQEGNEAVVITEDSPLPYPVKIHKGTIGKGCAWKTLMIRIQVHNKWLEQSPPNTQAKLDKAIEAIYYAKEQADLANNWKVSDTMVEALADIGEDNG